MRPSSGDLLIRRHSGSQQYVIADATTGRIEEGPFERADYAVGVAQSLAERRGVRVWQEHIDDRGAVFGPPTLLQAK